MKKILLSTIAVLGLAACYEESVADREAQAVERQQSQMLIAQPVPAYDYSLERDLLIQLYNARNSQVTTHSVWRSNTGLVEGDCTSMGFGMPYDTSLTNPLVQEQRIFGGAGEGQRSRQFAVVEQPEPNGVFASKNTSATWVFCLNDAGIIEPHYVESKVSVYPYSVTVNYTNNRVVKSGESTVQLQAN